MTALASGRYGGAVRYCDSVVPFVKHLGGFDDHHCPNPECVAGWVPVDATDRHDCYTWTLYCPICDRGTVDPLWARVVCLGDKVLTAEERVASVTVIDSDGLALVALGEDSIDGHPVSDWVLLSDLSLIVDDLGHRPEELRKP